MLTIMSLMWFFQYIILLDTKTIKCVLKYCTPWSLIHNSKISPEIQCWFWYKNSKMSLFVLRVMVLNQLWTFTNSAVELSMLMLAFFLSEIKSASFDGLFTHAVGDQFIKRRSVRIQFNCLTQPHSCVVSQARDWISINICHGLLCVQWFKVRGDCWICSYWWYFCPSLLNLCDNG